MRKYSFALVFAATAIIGCNRDTEMPSVGEAISDATVLLHSPNTAELESGDGYDEAKFLAFLEPWKPQ